MGPSRRRTTLRSPCPDLLLDRPDAVPGDRRPRQRALREVGVGGPAELPQLTEDRERARAAVTDDPVRPEDPAVGGQQLTGDDDAAQRPQLLVVPVRQEAGRALPQLILQRDVEPQPARRTWPRD